MILDITLLTRNSEVHLHASDNTQREQKRQSLYYSISKKQQLGVFPIQQWVRICRCVTTIPSCEKIIHKLSDIASHHTRS